MRNRFDHQLERLNAELTEMGELIEDAIDGAISTLTDRSEEQKKQTDQVEKEINQKESDIESLCLKLLLQQQPVASDLRLISAALKMITDMERIGDQAADIADLSLFMPNDPPSDRMERLMLMANATTRMVKKSVQAFVDRDMELAQKVCAADDTVDELFAQVKSDLIAWIRQDVDNGELALDLLMVAKYFERIGDHAVNLAEWVIFSITGQHRLNATV